MPPGRPRKRVRNIQGLRNQGPRQPPRDANQDGQIIKADVQSTAEPLTSGFPESISSPDVPSEDEDHDSDGIVLLHDSIQTKNDDAGKHQQQEEGEKVQEEESEELEGSKRSHVRAHDKGGDDSDDAEWTPNSARVLLNKAEKRRKLAGV
jgi:hypothetical protein